MIPNQAEKNKLKSSESLSEQIFQKIKNDIFDFKLMPGQRFTETEIAKSYQVSRTPIRQALYRLQQDGYVDVHFRSGWQVKSLNFKSYEELYDLRTLLECYAVEQLCRLSKEQLRISLQKLIMQWCIDPSEYIRSLREISEQDEAFHCELVATASNAEMAKVHRDVSEKIRIIRRLDFSKESRIDATYHEHQKILNALLKQDLDETIHLLKAHIEQSRNEVKKITLEMLSKRDSF